MAHTLPTVSLENAKIYVATLCEAADEGVHSDAEPYELRQIAATLQAWIDNEERRRAAAPPITIEGMWPTPGPLYGVSVVQVPTRPCSVCQGAGTLTGPDYSKEQTTGGFPQVTRGCQHCGGQGRELVMGAPAE